MNLLVKGRLAQRVNLLSLSFVLGWMELAVETLMEAELAVETLGRLGTLLLMLAVETLGWSLLGWKLETVAVETLDWSLLGMTLGTLLSELAFETLGWSWLRMLLSLSVSLAISLIAFC